jgi:excinuclease ABC subunit B
MEGARQAQGAGRSRGRAGRDSRPAADPARAVADIAKLEKQMYEHARNLEFEEAARIRDAIRELRDDSLGFSGETGTSTPGRTTEPA